jgi:lactobin A/cerein 7B family class IIb bacteriocin
MKELEKNELMEVEGGLLFWATVAAGILIGAAIAIINDWDNFERGITGEPYKPKS